MQEQIVSFETAKLAKDKNFDWRCNFLKSYKEQKEHLQIGITNSKILKRNNNFVSTFKGRLPEDIAIPTQSLLQKWLREVHNLYVEVSHSFDKLIACNDFNFKIHNSEICLAKSGKGYLSYNTYEEALEQALQEALKLI